jgi:lysophospholipase L1-like esterase
MALRIVTLGDSVLDSCRYSGGAGTSAPELVARTLGAELCHLARDGHTANAVLTLQLPELPLTAPDTVLVVSVGGNDLLNAIYTPGAGARDYAKRLQEVLSLANERLRPSKVLLANIYDPSGHDASLAKWITNMERALELLASFNDAIASAAATHRARLVDLYSAFRESAGASPPWIVNRIEPSAEGARQIARLLGEAIRPAFR